MAPLASGATVGTEGAAAAVSVFVDTSAWYALYVQGDAFHERATAAHDRLMREAAILHTHDWVLLETLGLLEKRFGSGAAVGVCRAIRTSAVVQMHVLDGSLLDEVLGRYEAEASQGLVDLASFAVMERLGLSRAFSYDDDFAHAGFRLEV